MRTKTSGYSWWSTLIYACGWLFFRTAFILLFRLKVTGKEREPKRGRVIYAANHLSALDPPLLGSSLRRQLTYLAKKELLEIPVFGRILRVVHAQPVDRMGYARGALEAMRAALERDEAVILFPEGTRSKDGTLGEGKIGVGMLAVWTGAPVIPLYVSGTAHVKDALLWRGRFRVALGRRVEPPKVASAQERKQAYHTVTDQVMAEIARLKAAVDRESTHHSSTARGDRASAGDGAV